MKPMPDGDGYTMETASDFLFGGDSSPDEPSRATETPSGASMPITTSPPPRNSMIFTRTRTSPVTGCRYRNSSPRVILRCSIAALDAKPFVGISSRGVGVDGRVRQSWALRVDFTGLAPCEATRTVGVKVDNGQGIPGGSDGGDFRFRNGGQP